MPANLAEGQDANDIAIYIAKCSGNAHCGVTAARSSAAPGGGTTTTAQGGGGAAKPDGKAIFASAGCGGCHTLKAAGAKRQRRPESRRTEAVGADGREAGHERRRRHAALQGSAVGCADQGRRRVRRRQRRQVAPDALIAEPLPEHDVRRIAGAEVDARQLLPAVLRVEAARLARPELRREQRTVVRLPRQELREQRSCRRPGAATPAARAARRPRSAATSSHSSRWPALSERATLSVHHCP